MNPFYDCGLMKSVHLEIGGLHVVTVIVMLSCYNCEKPE